MRRLQITSNLSVFSDTVGQAKTNILTDLSITADTGASSAGSYNYSQRTKLVYNPAERRYLNFNSPSPLQSIIVRCEYVSIDGTSRPVILPPGCTFSIKFGFYRRA